MSWDPLSDASYGNQPYCNVAGYNLTPGRTDHARCRFGLLMNNENECGSPDSAIGFGCDRSYSGYALGAGSFTLTAGAYPRRGWIFVR